MNRTVQDIIQSIRSPEINQLSAPRYERPVESGVRVALGVASMIDHTTDEGFQITHGLSENGYLHCGHALPHPGTDVRQIIAKHKPSTLVLQDIREWDVGQKTFRDPDARFTNVTDLQKHPEIFKLTILKDAQQNPRYHSQAAKDMAANAWVIYYHPAIVHHLAPYTRPQHLIRTYHSLDPRIVPAFGSTKRKHGCLFSGAVSAAYPLRQRIKVAVDSLPIDVLDHPGYHRNGCVTGEFFKLLSEYKVSICTSSRFGYALRKIIESSAAGCRVITDLPVDEVMPYIDSNLIRIPPDISISGLADVIRKAIKEYDSEWQKDVAANAIRYYDYVAVTGRLAEDIEALRRTY